MSLQGPNWSMKQNALMVGDSAEPTWGWCCGCCCAWVPQQIRWTGSGFSDCSPQTGSLAPFNGHLTMEWDGYINAFNLCQWSGSFLADVDGTTRTHRYWLTYGENTQTDCDGTIARWAAFCEIVGLNHGGNVVGRGFVKSAVHEASNAYLGVYSTGVYTVTCSASTGESVEISLLP